MKCYFRIIRSNQATREDFLPAKDLGRRLTNPGMEREWAKGISVCDTHESAIERALEFPKLGSHLVAICLPEGLEVEVKKTGSHPNHFTMYGSPDWLLSLVAGDPTPVQEQVMKTSYELIDLVSGNLADVYPELEQALTVLAQLLHEHGSDELMEYGLLEIREDGELGESWSDEALLKKVKEFANYSTKLSRTA